ncbi:MAG: PSD1 and planctomycete cytochrome C domain-containing protein, partial [Planctomycetes bacterium]|nr:PSD1 and planctomycete cytochrome C domain-containing protein [Planctomycetota bacterium]
MFVILLLAVQSQSPLSFSRDVEPILSANCYECHGKAQQKGGFRIDLKSTAMAGVDFGDEPAILPGNADESILYWLVSSTDPNDRMPPAEKDPLPAKEIALLKEWIDQGAVWPDDGIPPTWPTKHWAYQVPRWPEIPQLQADNFSRNPIDRFIYSKLDGENIAPSPQANSQTLVRRTALDLTGLPPDLDAARDYLVKPTEASWQSWLDFLFDSPRYGENQALGWLDLSRYADSNGFEVDHARSMSPWRDWVIEAFNSNMPFDEFTAQQLAGDLIESPSLSQIVATGFHRNTMTNTEGGVDDEEYRVSAVVDRVNTTSSVWLGTTMACVQCHDHKYDPLTSNDYYSMYALFNDGQDGGTSHGPSVDVLNALEADENRRVQEDIASLKREVESLDISVASSASEILWVDESQPPRGQVEGDWTFSAASSETPVHRGASVRKQVGQKGTFVQHYFSSDTEGPVHKGDDSIYAWVYSSPVDPPSAIMLQIHATDWEHRVFWGEDGFSIGVSGTSSRLRQGDLPAPGEWVRIEMPLDLLGISPGTQLDGIAFSQIGGTVFWDEAGTLDGDPKVSEFRAKIHQLEQLLHQPRSSLIMAGVSEPRMTHILERGSFLSPGKKVSAGVPKVLNQEIKDSPTNRLEFSRWLTHPKNPLTSRVIMNRLWEQVFGVGLVATSEDFGTRGEVPSHPELLDWLALEFQRRAWDLKSMHRLMIDSA